MIAIEAALRTVLDRTARLPAETVALAAARGRVLRTAARADLDSPPFDASAMDGYAARHADLAQPLRVAGEASAGSAYAHALRPGECVRIFTGAPVPAGADLVLKQEDITREGDLVRVPPGTDRPTFIRRRGENRRAGEIVVPAGTLLGPIELAALASAGVTQPEVTRAPRCVHLVTGDEIVPPDQQPTGAQIRDSNSTLVAALLAAAGVTLAAQARAGDDLAAARAVAESFPAHDVLLISGGASVGDRDFARPLLQALGYTLHFDSINLRPGRPLVFASRGPQLAFALPGNPVSHWVTFHLFVAPLLRKLQTGRDAVPERHLGRLAAGSKSPPPDTRRTCWPARVACVDGLPEVTAMPLASSGDSLGLVGANALLLSPVTALEPGPSVEFISCQ